MVWFGLVTSMPCCPCVTGSPEHDIDELAPLDDAPVFVDPVPRLHVRQRQHRQHHERDDDVHRARHSGVADDVEPPVVEERQRYGDREEDRSA